MEIQVNTATPSVMHIDLNSCFAIVEQQANPLWRGKPLVVAAYDSPGGCVLAASVEAKRLGIRTGWRVKESREVCPELIVRMPDPAKYHFVHDKLMKVFRSFSPDVLPKSVDEAVLSFAGLHYKEEELVSIGKMIKRAVRTGIGEWLTVNVGISTNRFLAKLASGLHKPDGLDVINHQNLLDVLGSISLIDLPGINVRYQARLNAEGIFTPLEFYQATLDQLKKQVFGGITGYYWFLRLRGQEIDTVNFERKSFGQEYALRGANDNPRQLASLLLKLCEKMGRRLRKAGCSATGIHLGLNYNDGTFAHKGSLQHTQMYSTKSLFLPSLRILNYLGFKKKVTKISVACFNLQKYKEEQLGLFDIFEKEKQLSDALDKINDRFGEFVIKPALMMEMEDKILERIAFGGRKDLLEYYTDD